MQRLFYPDAFPFKGGVSTLQAWKPGHLKRLMQAGIDLRTAKNIARRQGWLVEENTVHNLVVTAGKNWLAQMIGNLQTVGITYHAFGSGTTAPAAGDTQLQTEITRQVITLATVAANVLTIDAYYTNGNCNYHIQEVGWFAGPSASATANSGILISHYLQNYDNSSSSNDLTFEWVITFS